MPSTASLNIEVKSSGVQTAERKLDKLTRQSKKTESNVIKLQDRFKSFGRNASAAVASVDGPLGGVSSRISSLTSLATTGGVAVTGLAVAVAGLGFVLQKGVRTLDGYNLELAKTEAILKATGFAAGVTAKELQDEAQAIAFNTLASVEGIQQAQAVLLTFDRVVGDARAEAVGLSQDLATVFGGTAASQATQLGKALQDPIKGITALNRVGVSFTDTQKEQIRLFTEAGEAAKAQGVILEAIKNQVGGAGAAVASGTLAGAFDTAGQAFANFASKLAKSTGVYDATLNFVNDLGDGLKRLSGALDDESLSVLTEKVQAQYKRLDDLQAQADATSNRRRKARIEQTIEAANRELDALLNQQAEAARIVAVEEEKKTAAVEASEAKQAEIREQARLDELSRLGKIRVARLKEEYLLSEELQLIAEERDAYIAEQTRERARETEEAYRDLRTAIGGSLDGVADITKAFAGEQSTAYKAAFAASKGFAVANASLNFATALTQVLADPSALTLPQKLANYTALATTGGTLLSTIAGVKYNGGRQQGGAVGASDAIMVGERGPELFVPGNSGAIINNNQLRNGGGGDDVNITIINQTTGRIDQVEKKQMSRNDVVLIIKEVVPAEIQNPNSRTSKVLKSQTTANRRLS